MANPLGIFEECIALWQEASALVAALPQSVKSKIPGIVKKAFGGADFGHASADVITHALCKAADLAVNVAAAATPDDSAATSTVAAWAGRVRVALDGAFNAQATFTPFQLAVARAEIALAHGTGNQAAVDAAHTARKGPQATRNAAFSAVWKAVIGK